MPVPSTRTPVRVARGTYANLSTVDALASLQEGEIAFATDEQRLYVKQGGGLTSISASSQAAPAPADVTASPAFAGGTGTQADPYQITSVGVPIAGATVLSAQTITFSGTAGDFLLISDDSDAASGDRFASQDVLNMDSGGKASLQLRYTDDPATGVNNTTYIGKFSVGTTHFIWTVVQSNLTELSQSTAATLSGSATITGTITSSEGSVTGGTSTYSLTGYQWQKSFDGSTFFDLQGETNSSYTIVTADASTFLRCAVSYSDSTSGAAGGPLTITLFTAATAPIPSISAPVINNVALSEDDTTGARFTSKVYSADVTMVNDGSPVSQKAIKGTVQATFTVPSATDALASYNNSVSTDVFTTPYTQNALSNIQDYGKSWYVNVAEYNDDHRLIEFHQRGSNFYIYAVNSNGSRGSQIRTWSIGGGTPYMQNTQMINRNGLLSFHGVQRTGFQNSHHRFLLRANDLNGTEIGPGTGYNTSTTDGHILWWFNSGRKLYATYNPNDTTNWSLTQGVSGYTSTDNWNQYHTNSAENYRGGFAYIEASDELVLVWYYSNWMRMDRWTINRQSGVEPGSWAVTKANSNTQKLQCNGLLGTWDLGSYGFWMIIKDQSSSYGIYKYNSSTKNIDKMSNMPSNIGGGYERFGMGVDASGNIQLSGLSNNGINTIAKARSTNGGSSWQATGTVSNPSGYETWNTNYASTGDTEIWGFVSESSSSQTGLRPFRKFSDQSATVTPSSLNVFGDTEKITKQGDEDNLDYKGTMEITNRTNGNIKLQTAGLWQNGDVVVSRVGGNTQSATKYLVLDSVGNVTNISSADPGFTTIGPGTEIDLTFPATFPSGDAPDTELPAGAAIQVEVEATNSVASDTYTSSSVIPD